MSNEQEPFVVYLGKDGEFDLLKITYLQFSAADRHHQVPVFRSIILRMRPENLPVVTNDGDTPQKTLVFSKPETPVKTLDGDMVAKLVLVPGTHFLSGILGRAKAMKRRVNLFDVAVDSEEVSRLDAEYKIRVSRAELIEEKGHP